MKDFTKILTISVFCFLFTTNILANNTNTHTKQDNHISLNDYLIEKPTNLITVLKDGKWRKFWKEFVEGFLEGFGDAIKPTNNGNNNNSNTNHNITKADLNYLTKYALEKVRNKDNAIAKMIQIQDLIENDKNTINEKELMTAFDHDPRIREIIKHIMKGKRAVQPDDKFVHSVKRMKSINKISRIDRIDNEIIIHKESMIGGKGIGYIIGWIVGKLVKENI